MTYDVFISYSSENSNIANAICHTLEENKIRCWIAPRDIFGGAKYGDAIEEAIRSCKVFVIVFSEYSSVSAWVEGELNIAFTEGRTIVPFKIDSSKLTGSMRLILNNKHWIEAYPNPELKFKDLINAVSLAIGRQPTISKESQQVEEVDFVINTNSNSKPSINKNFKSEFDSFLTVLYWLLIREEGIKSNNNETLIAYVDIKCEEFEPDSFSLYSNSVAKNISLSGDLITELANLCGKKIKVIKNPKTVMVAHFTRDINSHHILELTGYSFKSKQQLKAIFPMEHVDENYFYINQKKVDINTEVYVPTNESIAAQLGARIIKNYECL